MISDNSSGIELPIALTLYVFSWRTTDLLKHFLQVGEMFSGNLAQQLYVPIHTNPCYFCMGSRVQTNGMAD